MEIKRIELLTSAVQGQRSSQLSYTPEMIDIPTYRIFTYTVAFSEACVTLLLKAKIRVFLHVSDKGNGYLEFS